MRLFDSHVHTINSPDGHDTIVSLLEDAKNRNFYYLATTDHLDLDLKVCKENKTPVAWNHIDLDKYYSEWKEAAKDTGDVKFRFGIEAGYDKGANEAYIETFKRYPFDVVINSVHFVDHWDVYFLNPFIFKSKKRIYRHYLEKILESLDAPYQYDIVGHIGYVTRNAPYKDKSLRLADFEDLIDAILKKIIEKDKALEINTHHGILPTEEILQRYYDLGGRRISFGSDTHRFELGKDLDVVAALAKKIGFTHFSVYTNHIPEEIEIP